MSMRLALCQNLHAYGTCPVDKGPVHDAGVSLRPPDENVWPHSVFPVSAVNEEMQGNKTLAWY